MPVGSSAPSSAYSISTVRITGPSSLGRIVLLYPPKPLTIKECIDAVRELIEKHDLLSEGRNRIHEALTSGKGIQYIVDVASDLLENPLFVWIRDLRLLPRPGDSR